MSKILYVTGGYDVLDYFLHEMVKYYRERGYELFEYNIKDPIGSLGGLYSFIENGNPDMVLFSNQVGIFTEIKEGLNLWDALGVMCVDIMMDHPFTYTPALTTMPKNTICICQDRNHMKFLQRFYPEIETVGFLPHGGTLQRGEIPLIRDRSIDVLYTGGISRPFVDKVMPDFGKYDFPAEEYGREILDILIGEPWHTSEEIIEQVLLSHGVEFEDHILRDVIYDMRYVDLLATSYYREKTIRTLVDNGIKVTLNGAGWDKTDIVKHPNLAFGGMAPINEAVQKGLISKIVLSTMTWFKDGTHDRVFSGMLAGAVSVTDSSVYMKEIFTDDEAPVMFELSEMDTLADTVKGLLEDEDRMQKLSIEGKERAERDLTWQHRAAEIEEALLN